MIQQPTIHTEVKVLYGGSGDWITFIVPLEAKLISFQRPVADIYGTLHLVSGDHAEHIILRSYAVGPEEKETFS